MLRSLLLSGAAAAVLCVGQPAFAQNAGAAVEEVVVTAERREENLQQVPMSVTALSASQLQRQGVSSTTSLTQAVPGLVFTTSTIGAQPTIRGIGTRSVSTGVEANVAIYVDGVYQGQPYANIFDLNDVASIQVLKGPQGSLYGRNATGGAIVITTRRPSFTPTAEVSATYGSFGYRGANLYASGPLVGDVLAGSIAAVGYKDHGYAHNVFLQTRQAARDLAGAKAKLLFHPTDKFEALLSAYYSNGEDTAGVAGHARDGNTSVRKQATAGNYPPNILIPQGDYDTATGFLPKARARQAGLDLHLNYDLGFAELGAMASQHHSFKTFHYDPDVSPISVSDTYIAPHSISNEYEATLTSKSDQRFTWLVGYNHFWDDTATRPQIATGVTSTYGVKTTADALFGEATWELLDNLYLTGGLRWNRDKKEAWHQRFTAPAVRATGNAKWTSTTPRVVLRYEFNPATSAYVSYSQGFKSGIFDASSPAGASSPVNPEKVKAWEAGLKAEITPRWRMNVAAYRYDYTDLQVVIIQVSPTGAFNSIQQNAAASEIYGFEGDTQFVLDENWNVSANLSLLHTEFTRFPNASVVAPAPLFNGLGAGGVTAILDATGNKLIRSPKATGNITVNYDHPLLGGDLSATASLFMSAKFYADVNNRTFQPSYSMLNASATWHAPGDRYYMRLEGQNLNNAKVAVQIFTSTLADVVAYQRPRTILFTVGYRY